MKIEKNKIRIINPWVLLWVLLVVLLVRGFLYIFVIPPWQHPDEPTHFEHVRLIAEQKALPTPDSISIPLRREIGESMARNKFWDFKSAPQLTDAALSNPGISAIGVYTLTHPRLYYVVAAAWLLPWVNLPVESQLYLVRMLSVILNFFVVIVVFKMVRELYPGSLWLPIVTATFVTFQPMHTDIMSAVNNDVLVNLIGGVFFLALAVIFRHGLSIRRVLLLIAILALGMLTKTTAVVLLLSLPLAVLFYLWRAGHLSWFLGIVLLSLVIMAAGFLLWQLDILPGWLDQAAVWVGRYFRVDISSTLDGLQDPEYQNLAVRAAPFVYQSFWGVFGWRHIWVASGWYTALGVFSLLSLLGLFGMALRNIRDKKEGRVRQDPLPFLAFALCAVLLAWMVAILRSLADQGMNTYLSHGRYIFVVMGPFALLFTLGLQAWVRESLQRFVGVTLILGLIIFDAVCFWGTVVPYYY